MAALSPMVPPSVPYTLRLARRMSVRGWEASRYDVTMELAKLRRQRPTGVRDKTLIVAASHDRHADVVATALVADGCPVFRLDVDAYPGGVSLSLELGQGRPEGGVLASPAGELALGEVRSVLMRRRVGELFGIGPPPDDVAAFVERESAAALSGMFALLDGALWVDRPDRLYASDSKVAQLRAAAGLGLPVPRTLVTDDPDRARAFVRSCPAGAVAKAFRGQVGATPETVRVIAASRVGEADWDLLDTVRHAPVQFQELVAKAADVRVTVVGDAVLPVAIRPRGLVTDDTPIDHRAADWRAMVYEPVTLPAPVEAACRALLARWGLALAGIDLIVRPDGEHVFLEMNTMADWLWVEGATDLPITRAVADLLRGGGEAVTGSSAGRG